MVNECNRLGPPKPDPATESALSAHHVDFIDLRLRHTIQELRLEEREMREELGSGKGENRMQVIQDLIGVGTSRFDLDGGHSEVEI